jgi:hypothetical protein
MELNLSLLLKGNARTYLGDKEIHAPGRQTAAIRQLHGLFSNVFDLFMESLRQRGMGAYILLRTR